MLPTTIKNLWAKPAVRRTFTAAFLALVLLLIVQEARVVDWREVATSVRAYDGLTLTIAMVLSAFSYLVYSCFDLLGRYYTKSKLTVLNVMSTAFVSFAFNQSVGSLIGAVAFRLRMYSSFGVKAKTISKIIGLSIVTNWLGYSAIAGMLFVSNFISMPPDMDVGPSGLDLGRGVLRVTGLLMLATVMAYLLICAVAGGKEVTFKDKRLAIPTLRLAMLQLLLAIMHWPMAAAIIYVLLDGKIEFVTILGALLLTAIAVVLTHIPAGIGVLEAIFVGMLRHRIPTTQILAALLVFRAVYYLAPLALASVLYLKTEASSKNPMTHRPALGKTK